MSKTWTYFKRRRDALGKLFVRKIRYVWGSDIGGNQRFVTEHAAKLQNGEIVKDDTRSPIWAGRGAGLVIGLLKDLLGIVLVPEEELGNREETSGSGNFNEGLLENDGPGNTGRSYSLTEDQEGPIHDRVVANGEGLFPAFRDGTKTVLHRPSKKNDLVFGGIIGRLQKYAEGIMAQKGDTHDEYLKQAWQYPTMERPSLKDSTDDDPWVHEDYDEDTGEHVQTDIWPGDSIPIPNIQNLMNKVSRRGPVKTTPTGLFNYSPADEILVANESCEQGAKRVSDALTTLNTSVTALIAAINSKLFPRSLYVSIGVNPTSANDSLSAALPGKLLANGVIRGGAVYVKIPPWFNRSPSGTPKYKIYYHYTHSQMLSNFYLLCGMDWKKAGNNNLVTGTWAAKAAGALPGTIYRMHMKDHSVNPASDDTHICVQYARFGSSPLDPNSGTFYLHTIEIEPYDADTIL